MNTSKKIVFSNEQLDELFDIFINKKMSIIAISRKYNIKETRATKRLINEAIERNKNK